MKVAIVYDRANKIGGAERVLESLMEIFPTATFFTSIHSKKKTPWAKKIKTKTSFIQKIPVINNRHELIPYLMPLAFESFSFLNYNLVVSVTSEAAKGVIVPPNTNHICICLTPTRYLWSGYDEYFKNPIFKFLAYPLIEYLRRWDISAARRPDHFIAISKAVQDRIKKYYKRESTVIYPPADRLSKSVKTSVKIPEENYFLVVSRLVEYKKIELAVRACTRLKIPLIVIGEGSEYEKLDAIAGETVIFKGKLSDEEVWSYYKKCRALIFPGLEDFGITMVEAQSAGKPVIAYKGGGALEIVKEKITGEFFDNQTVHSLSQVLLNFKDSRYNGNECRRNALRFSDAKFRRTFIRFLKEKKII